MKDYLAGLNEPQREAVTHIDGPLMIIAGAGSGKTRVLTYRIAYLIEKGVDPFNILALTFTNKAAEEMRHRIEKVIGPEAKNLWMGTFHSVFSKILRFDGHKLGYTSNFTIYDTDDSKSLLRSIIKEMGLDDKAYKPNYVLNRISAAKNNLISWQMYNENPSFAAEDIAAQMPELGRIYKTYALRCFSANAMDFDDLLFNTNVLFRDHLDVLNKYQHKFRHVMVDEFQDTNISQYLITRKLAAVSQNICVVGDDAQSIYAFRGANIQNILNFKKDYPDLKVVKLEQNYRSTKNIVNAANSVIAKNKAQLEKNIFSDNEEGEKIEVIRAMSDNEEGRLIAHEIFEGRLRGLKNSDFAILYRTNAQSRAFEEALRKIDIPYRIIGGLSFYQRKEIKDILAYLRFTVNQQDEEAFKRIINTPKRGIGDTSVAKIIVLASEHQTSIWNIVSNIQFYMEGRTANAVAGFADLIKSYTVMMEEGKDAHTLAMHVAKTSGLLHELYMDKTVEGVARHENVQELLNSIRSFVDNDENEDKSLSSFLQTVSLLTTADEDDDGDAEKVTLMTIHGAKGLEFKHVFVVGLEENLFPSQMMLKSRDDLEEERRLFYVAITRAEKQLTLSYAQQRYTWGKLTYCEPSRFLEEIDSRYLRFGDKGIPQTFEPSFAPKKQATRPVVIGEPVKRASANALKPVQPPVQAHVPSADFEPSDTSKLKVGDKVEHQKFGFGEVKKLEAFSGSTKAHILFEREGEKTLLLSFAKLRIL
ncbi:UvrD/REP helicase [Leadbetterella byssophila DSM 17132]|uniref:DNA 3'-5' helicase n=1 Tax=Leadbetterella byssophila (strain DSM 17132 / JCM 16389 / KACC 11308 / NBRC 106382 / 4M15) TaxID=649349 RepID=E4RZG0_LEAB4|nr:UvrD-helicase domain-containing protein [Leadbetterella byssophila]ADQ17384.1 UvrD/REP helicase [Leadbetterella byssophila DSM 17132]